MHKAESTYKHTPGFGNGILWLFLAGCVLVLFSDRLLSEGMFVDGVTYASIARNMAEGHGSFWNPHYTQTLYAAFHQHPPLALGMEALFFKVLGDHLFVERLYSLLMFAVSGLLIAAIWRRTSRHPKWAWLPVLFWLTMPLVSWAAKNNMLENTMTGFVLLSVWLMILNYQKNNKLLLVLSGIPLLFAFLSKGFTGLFPLAFPLIYTLFDERRPLARGVLDTLLLLGVVGALSGLVFLLFPASLPYLEDYLRLQVIGGGLHEATVSSRFFIVVKLLEQMLLPCLVLLALYLVVKVSTRKREMAFAFGFDRKWLFTWLVLGLSGVLPIMVSVKQSGFYMVSALPFFALACGHLSLSMVTSLREAMRPNRCLRGMVNGLAGLVLAVGLFLCGYHANTYCRDEALIEEVKRRIAEADGKDMIEISPEEYTNWAAHAYFMRYGKISLNPTQQFND